MRNQRRLARRATVVLSLVLPVTLTAATEPFQRDLSTDRPDATESPYTVERARWQIEAEAVRWSRDTEAGVQVETLVLGATNFKYGLTDSSDLQIVVEPAVRQRIRIGSRRETVSGFGDTIVRLKHNLAGNDGGSHAFGIMPFIKLPTADRALGNGNVEGGLIVPYAGTLPNGWGFGLMGEIDVVRNASDTDYEPAFLATATIAGEIAPNVGLFLELVNESREFDPSNWATTFNTGLTLACSDNLQLDGGINVGLTDEAEDLAVFFGVSARW